MFYSINNNRGLNKAPTTLLLEGGPSIQTHTFSVVKNKLHIKPLLSTYAIAIFLMLLGVSLVLVNSYFYFTEWITDYLWLIALGIVVIGTALFFSRYLYIVIINLHSKQVTRYDHLFFKRILPENLLSQNVIGFQVLKKEISKGRDRVTIPVYEVNLVLQDYSRLLLFHIKVSGKAETLIEEFKKISQLARL